MVNFAGFSCCAAVEAEAGDVLGLVPELVAHPDSTARVLQIAIVAVVKLFFCLPAIMLFLHHF
jgi:hypothetical protein